MQLQFSLRTVQRPETSKRRQPQKEDNLKEITPSKKRQLQKEDILKEWTISKRQKPQRLFNYSYIHGVLQNYD